MRRTESDPPTESVQAEGDSRWNDRQYARIETAVRRELVNADSDAEHSGVAVVHSCGRARAM
jgi:hypothetical protein